MSDTEQPTPEQPVAPEQPEAPEQGETEAVADVEATADAVETEVPEDTDTPTEAEASAETGAPAETSPAPPKPRPVPKPSAFAKAKPAAPAQAPAAPRPGTAEPAAGQDVPIDPAARADAAQFGRVDDDGTVYVRDGDAERLVGQYPNVAADEALSLYIRRFLDLKAQVDLFAARLDALTAKDLDATVASLREALAEPAAVGDLPALRAHLAELEARAHTRKEQLAAERAQAREVALAERTAIVEAAEKLAGRDPAKIQWRDEGNKLRDLLEQWKTAQRNGPRLDRPTEDSLWKRFSVARSQFGRNRRQHFAELDRTHAEVKATKERLIERAEALSTSKDWPGTSAAYRELMDEWKRAGRASRKEDDALWARFRAAQDVFFDARGQANAAVDAEYEANLQVKLALLDEAEALLPISDLDRAKAALRDIQDRWEDAGKVPRGDIGRVEGRLRSVEQAIRDTESKQWRSSNPRVRARAEGAAAQLEAAIGSLEEDLARAKADGDDRAIAQATEALAARKAWLEQVLQAADDAR